MQDETYIMFVELIEFASNNIVIIKLTIYGF